jgi:hypothetical protein
LFCFVCVCVCFFLEHLVGLFVYKHAVL